MPTLVGGYRFLPSYSAAAQQFFDRITDPGVTRRNQYATLIDGLVADNVWSLLDALWIYAATTSVTALTNLKSSSYGCTANGAMTFTANTGYRSDNVATSYLSMGYNPSTAGGNLTLNSASIGGYSLTSDTGTGFWTVMGCSDASANGLFLWPNTGGGNGGGRVNAGGAQLVTPPANMQGMHVFTRTASTTTVLYKNGTSLGSNATASSALPNANLIVFARNNNGTNDDPWPDQMSAAFIGGGLDATKASALSSRINTYMTSLGINVY